MTQLIVTALVVLGAIALVGWFIRSQPCTPGDLLSDPREQEKWERERETLRQGVRDA